METGNIKTTDFSIVEEFEKKIAEFFGAPFAVAVDSCTHAIEICLRFNESKDITCPNRTYLSIPMLASKLNIPLYWRYFEWENYYCLTTEPNPIIDAAVYWKKDGYISNTLMCISFQYQKHLSLGRGGVILCSTKEQYDKLKKMSYDGRLPNTPWREQNIDMIGYHYYMTPETAKLGLEKLEQAISTKPKQWVYTDWPDLTQMDIFKK